MHVGFGKGLPSAKNGDGRLLSPLFIPIPLMLLGVFTSAIQALVFATLAGAYIGESIEDHH